MFNARWWFHGSCLFWLHIWHTHTWQQPSLSNLFSSLSLPFTPYSHPISSSFLFFSLSHTHFFIDLWWYFRGIVFGSFLRFCGCTQSFSLLFCSEQCDQIGLFLKGLGDKLSYSRCPNSWQLFGYFLGKFGENWVTFYFSNSSHCLLQRGRF